MPLRGEAVVLVTRGRPGFKVFATGVRPGATGPMAPCGSRETSSVARFKRTTPPTSMRDESEEILALSNWGETGALAGVEVDGKKSSIARQISLACAMSRTTSLPSATATSSLRSPVSEGDR